MAILDAGILAMAWFKAWRPLNLVGAVATFALAGAWAHQHYVAADYAGVQAFLVFFFLLLTFTGVLYARRALAAGDAPSEERPLAERAVDALRQVGRVDSTLTFGVPLAAFSLQYLLVRDMAWGPAWAAAAFALFHILLGGVLMRDTPPRYALLGEAHVIVGTLFATLAIPLALQGAWTGATWAIESAGMYWLGARQRRTYARAFALLVMLGAAMRLVAGLSLDLRDGVPLLAGSTLGMAMLALALCAMDAVRRRVAAAARGRVEEIAALAAPFPAAFAFAALAWMRCPMLWAGAITAWIGYGGAALAGRLAAPSLRVASVLLHLGALTAMTLSLQVTDSAPAHAWHDLVAALLIGAALLATGWLGLRDAWREAAQGTPRPIPLGNSIGLVLGLAVASASLLFEMAPDDAALAWPVIGLAAAWIGLRLRSSRGSGRRRRRPRRNKCRRACTRCRCRRPTKPPRTPPARRRARPGSSTPRTATTTCCASTSRSNAARKASTRCAPRRATTCSTGARCKRTRNWCSCRRCRRSARPARWPRSRIASA